VLTLLDINKEKRFLSFAWLAWDILKNIRQQKLQVQDTYKSFVFDPLSERLSTHIKVFIDAKEDEYQSFCDEVINKSEAKGALVRYCGRFEGMIFFD